MTSKARMLEAQHKQPPTLTVPHGRFVVTESGRLEVTLVLESDVATETFDIESVESLLEFLDEHYGENE